VNISGNLDLSGDTDQPVVVEMKSKNGSSVHLPGELSIQSANLTIDSLVSSGVMVVDENSTLTFRRPLDRDTRKKRNTTQTSLDGVCSENCATQRIGGESLTNSTAGPSVRDMRVARVLRAHNISTTDTEAIATFATNVLGIPDHLSQSIQNGVDVQRL
jgi:hypothetical protein